MKGYCFIVRFAADFIIGCQHEEDARRIVEVLPKRFERYGLSIRPEKTKRDRSGGARRQARGHRQEPAADLGADRDHPSGMVGAGQGLRVPLLQLDRSLGINCLQHLQNSLLNCVFGDFI